MYPSSSAVGSTNGSALAQQLNGAATCAAAAPPQRQQDPARIRLRNPYAKKPRVAATTDAPTTTSIESNKRPKQQHNHAQQQQHEPAPASPGGSEYPPHAVGGAARSIAASTTSSSPSLNEEAAVGASTGATPAVASPSFRRKSSPRAAAASSPSSSGLGASPQAAATEKKQHGDGVLAASVPDPRQRTLPHALQFDPGSVLPDADDGRDIPDGSRYFTHGNDIGPELRKALVRHADVSSDLDNGWKLFSHQKRAVLFALRQRRSILALDMGTGKTLIGCVWARAFFRAFRGDCQVVVICPVSLKSNWERTAAEATGLLVASPNPSVIIASWASVPAQLRGGIAEESTEGDSDCSDVVAAFSRCQSRRRPFKYYVVVADEAHSMQSMAAKRTQQALQLMLDRRCVGALLLTGTPLKNGKPANLFPLLRAVKHPLASCQRAYEEHFCDGRYHSFGNKQPIWKAGGAQNLDQLRELASSHVLFLSKEDVLKGLPPQTRIKKRVPVSAQWQARHAKALHELSVAFDSSQDQLGGNSGVNSGTDKKNDDKAVLGALQRLRKVGSLAKADAAARLAAQVLEEEPAVVVFSSFVDVSASIHKQLGNIGWTGELLTGETPPHKRQDMVDRFQRGESAAFCCTFGAGGVGLTLTASATVILVDRPWTPGDAAQAEDRVRRIGQAKPVTSIWISAFDLDDQIDVMLEQKKQNAATVLDERQKTEAAAVKDRSPERKLDPAAKLSIWKMLRAVLPPSHHRSIGGSATGSAPSSNQHSYLKQTSILQFSQSRI